MATALLIVKTLIWTAFAISLFGYMLGAILVSRSARRILVETWYETSIKLDSSKRAQSEIDFYDRMLKKFLLSKTGNVSLLKIAPLSLLGTVLLFIGILGGTNIFYKPGQALDAAPAILLVHWILEYVSAIILMACYRHYFMRPLAYRVLLSTLISAGVLCCISVYSSSILLSTRDGIPLGLVLHGYSLFPLSVYTALLGEEESSFYLVFITLSIVPTLFGAWLWLTISAVRNNNFVLRATRLLCERLDSLAAPAVLATSSLVFGISTGLMQAFSF